jgi:hypothetical protein
MADLITLARAKVNAVTASSTGSDDSTLSQLINSASKAVQRYCRRDFVQAAYDELYNGNGNRRLHLRQYPIVSVQSVRYRPVTVLKVINTLVNTPQARVTVTSTGLTLLTVTSGTPTTLTVPFAGNPTIVAVQNAINALGNGWNAQGTGYDQWPAADLRSPQGALTAAGQNAELKLHTYELAGYQIDERRGWLLRAIPYTDPELLHPEDLVWPVGINNFRVQYTAGYAPVPEDVQEAAAQLVAMLFKDLGRNQNLVSENLTGAAYRALTDTDNQLPRSIRVLLQPYRSYPTLEYMG